MRANNRIAKKRGWKGRASDFRRQHRSTTLSGSDKSALCEPRHTEMFSDQLPTVNRLSSADRKSLLCVSWWVALTVEDVARGSLVWAVRSTIVSSSTS